MAGAQSLPPLATLPADLSFTLPVGNQQASGALQTISDTIQRPYPNTYNSCIVTCFVRGTGSINYQILDGNSAGTLNSCADPNGNQTGVAAGAIPIPVAGLRAVVGVKITQQAGQVLGVNWTFDFYNGTRWATSADVVGTVSQGNANTDANAWPVVVTDKTNTLAMDAHGSAHSLVTDAGGANTLGVDAHGSAHAGLYDTAGTAISATDPLPTSDLMPGTPITASSANEANAPAVATLAAAVAKTTYITGFQATASGATSGFAVTVTVAGLITGTQNYTFVFPAGVLVAAQPLIVEFSKPIPASAVNTAIVVTLPASGAGGTNATVSAQGFQL